MSQIHAKTDKLTLVAVAQPGEKMRVTSQSWDDPLITLPGEVLILSPVGTQVHVTRYGGQEISLARPAPADPDPHEDAGTDFEE